MPEKFPQPITIGRFHLNRGVDRMWWSDSETCELLNEKDSEEAFKGLVALVDEKREDLALIRELFLAASDDISNLRASKQALANDYLKLKEPVKEFCDAVQAIDLNFLNSENGEYL